MCTYASALSEDGAEAGGGCLLLPAVPRGLPSLTGPLPARQQPAWAGHPRVGSLLEEQCSAARLAFACVSHTISRKGVLQGNVIMAPTAIKVDGKFPLELVFHNQHIHKKRFSYCGFLDITKNPTLKDFYR